MNHEIVVGQNHDDSVPPECKLAQDGVLIAETTTLKARVEAAAHELETASLQLITACETAAAALELA